MSFVTSIFHFGILYWFGTARYLFLEDKQLSRRTLTESRSVFCDSHHNHTWRPTSSPNVTCLSQHRSSNLLIQLLCSDFLCALRVRCTHPRSRLPALASTPRTLGKRPQVTFNLGPGNGNRSYPHSAIWMKCLRLKPSSYKYRSLALYTLVCQPITPPFLASGCIYTCGLMPLSQRHPFEVSSATGGIISIRFLIPLSKWQFTEYHPQQ